eukprot:TRINITY_DN1494_c0_g1_i3.p1 TRINITY_DN1494_c0_g1~~TRINITY_DN1494_c0_g1_i3.p1  ORF type:complete len:277 (+),score=58.50 TRINITY_DN1494_c0_g1_i3:98-832(+)
MSLDLATARIGFLPGTGRMGFGLALLYAKAGHHVGIGSRSAEKAAEYAAKLKAEVPAAAKVYHGSLPDVAAQSDVIFWAPMGTLEQCAAALSTLKPHLHGQLFIDLNNVYYLKPKDTLGQVSAIDVDRETLGTSASSVRWAHAFKCTAWKLLESPKDPSGARIEVMYGGESFDVRENVRKLIESIGYIGLDTYGVEYCRHVEALLDLSVTMLSAGEGLQNVKSWGYYWAFTSKRFEQQSGRVEP